MMTLLLLMFFQEPIKMDERTNFGIGPRQEFAAGEKITLDGREVSRAAVMQLLQAGAPDLPNDKNMPWLIYVGKDKTEALKARVQLAPLAHRFRIQAASEGEWYTKHKDGSVRFKAGLTVLLADGTEVYQTDDVQSVLDKLRSVPEDFDLRKLPDLFRIPLPSPIPPSISGTPTWAWILGGLFVLILLQRRKA